MWASINLWGSKMPVPKDKQKLYGKIVGFNINHGKSAEEAKKIADAAIKPGHQRNKKSK